MREALDQWDFVVAAYLFTAAALLLLIGWSWRTMRQAEQRRSAARDSERA